MSLKYVDVVKAQIDAQLPDNSTGVITPAVLRGLLHDIVDSLYTRAITGVFGNFFGVPVLQALTGIPTVCPAIAPSSLNNHPALFATAPSAVTVLAPGAGFAFLIDLGATFSGAVNTDVYMALYRNGVRVDRFLAGARCTGVADLKSVAASAALGGIAAGDVLDMRFWSPQGAVNISFTSVSFNIMLVPVNAAV